tara:strand:- start:5943 stop:6281 length:339 start_codon:yes stop_codon:yes gene_type:complete
MPTKAEVIAWLTYCIANGRTPLPEICICAAVKATTGEIIRGHRHSDCFTALRARLLLPERELDSQGFITSHNRYVDRAEGMKLQKAAGIPSKYASSQEAWEAATVLFSEDLY